MGVWPVILRKAMAVLRAVEKLWAACPVRSRQWSSLSVTSRM